MATVEVSVTTPGIDRMIAKISDTQRVSAEIADAWSILYRSFVRLRFAKFAKGGGNWAKLKPATIERRRKGKKPRGVEILRDTGAMFSALQPSVQGGILQQRVKTFGMTIMLGGGRNYSNGPTLSQVASYHHRGDGNLPKREILVVPDAATVKKMGDVAKRIIARKLNEK